MSSLTSNRKKSFKIVHLIILLILQKNVRVKKAIGLIGFFIKYYVWLYYVKALRAIDLSVNGDEYVVFMDASGSGKSTLINIIGCIDSFKKVRFFLNGVDVNFMSANKRSEIRNSERGFIFQTFNLIHDSKI